MSFELDNVSKSLFNGSLPSSWQLLAPDSLKSLGNWINHFLRRHAQYKAWVSSVVSPLFTHLNLSPAPRHCEHSDPTGTVQVEKGEPKVMWLSGLHVPESYLTALVQAACRKNGWALDHSTLYTAVTSYADPDNVNEHTHQGNVSPICNII